MKRQIKINDNILKVVGVLVGLLVAFFILWLLNAIGVWVGLEVWAPIRIVLVIVGGIIVFMIFMMLLPLIAQIAIVVFGVFAAIFGFAALMGASAYHALLEVFNRKDNRNE